MDLFSRSPIDISLRRYAAETGLHHSTIQKRLEQWGLRIVRERVRNGRGHFSLIRAYQGFDPGLHPNGKYENEEREQTANKAQSKREQSANKKPCAPTDSGQTPRTDRAQTAHKPRTNREPPYIKETKKQKDKKTNTGGSRGRKLTKAEKYEQLLADFEEAYPPKAGEQHVHWTDGTRKIVLKRLQDREWGVPLDRADEFLERVRLYWPRGRGYLKRPAYVIFKRGEGNWDSLLPPLPNQRIASVAVPGVLKRDVLGLLSEAIPETAGYVANAPWELRGARLVIRCSVDEDEYALNELANAIAAQMREVGEKHGIEGLTLGGEMR